METFDPTVARLRRVLELTAAGRTQVEIATALNCTEKTVRNLLKRAREREVSSFRTRSPEALLADVESKAAVNYARMTNAWAKARATGNLRAEIAILARMDMAQWGRVAMLARVGYFDNIKFANGAEDESTRRLDQGRREIEMLVDLSVRTNRGEDISLISYEEPEQPASLEDIEPLY